MTDWLLNLGSTASPNQETQFVLKGWEEMESGGGEREGEGERQRERRWDKSLLPLDAVC